MGTIVSRRELPSFILSYLDVILSTFNQPPELRILSIGDIASDRFRGIFQLTYSGDAFIVLSTLVQANPLTHLRSPPLPSDLPSSILPTMLFASSPLLVPMHLRLSDLKLSATVVLVVSLQKGITLVFKNDPLQSVSVSSTFDKVGVIQGFIQREIESQLRELFRSDLPELIHGLSRKWFEEYRDSKKAEDITDLPTERKGSMLFAADATLETSIPVNPNPNQTQQISSNLIDDSSSNYESPIPPSIAISPPSPMREYPTNQDYLETSSVPDSIQNYDPTYGLRPESLPLKSNFDTYRRLLKREKRKGLASILDGGDNREDVEREADSDDEDSAAPSNLSRRIGKRVPNNQDSLNFMNLRDLVANSQNDFNSQASSVFDTPSKQKGGFQFDFDNRSRSGDSVSAMGIGSIIKLETFPAVGGGIISRPRILHSMSYRDEDIKSRFGSVLASSKAGSESELGIKPKTINHKDEEDWKTEHSFSASSVFSPPYEKSASSQTSQSRSSSSNMIKSLVSSSSPQNDRDPDFLLSIDPSDFNARFSSVKEEVVLDPRENFSCGMINVLSNSNMTMSVNTRGWEGSRDQDPSPIYVNHQNLSIGGVSTTFSGNRSEKPSLLPSLPINQAVPQAKIISKTQTPLILLEKRKNLELKQLEELHERIPRGGKGGKGVRKRVYRIGEAGKKWQQRMNNLKAGEEKKDRAREEGRDLDEMSDYFPRTEGSDR
jgi:mitochondrial distribution and morphology protein 34